MLLPRHHRIIFPDGTMSFDFGGNSFNVTQLDVAMLTASIWEGEGEGVPVPIIELVAHAVLVVSITLALIRVALRRRRGPRKLIISDAWQPAAAEDFSGVISLLFIVVALDLAAALVTVVIMLVPIDHDGVFANTVYSLHGVFDNVPWLLCLRGRRERPSRLYMLTSAALVVGATLVRLFSVLGQPPLTDYLFTFAPTPMAMCTNMGMGLFYLLLLLLTCCPAALTSNRNAFRISSSRLPTLCRLFRLPSQSRLWLLLLATSYMGSATGYFLFMTVGVPPLTALWIGEAALYLYALCYGPALFCTFRRIAPDWLGTPTNSARASASLNSGAAAAAAAGGATSRTGGRERLLAADATPTRPPTKQQQKQTPQRQTPTAPLQASPTLALPPGAVFHDAGSQAALRLQAAVGGVRIIAPDHMKLHELIGSGGFAEVFRATWKADGGADAAAEAGRKGDEEGASGCSGGAPLQVAVKVLRSLPRQSALFDAFCKEIALHHRLSHPHVVSLLGVSLLRSGQLSVVTHYCERGSVFQMLHPRGRPAAPLHRVRAVRMLADCAKGMAYLHSMSPPVIHRDLKSQNLLVAHDYSVMVADFGLSRECLRPGAMTRVGSVQWAAPEVLLGKAYSHKCDLWSFGVVCWELLTARVPFDGMPQTEVATKVAMEGMRLPVPPRTPLQLLKLIARCWVDNPDARPSFEAAEIELVGVENTVLDEDGEPLD